MIYECNVRFYACLIHLHAQQSEILAILILSIDRQGNPIWGIIHLQVLTGEDKSVMVWSRPVSIPVTLHCYYFIIHNFTCDMRVRNFNVMNIYEFDLYFSTICVLIWGHKWLKIFFYQMSGKNLFTTVVSYKLSCQSWIYLATSKIVADDIKIISYKKIFSA